MAADYEIEAVLDEGRFTRVLRGRRCSDGLPVVLKHLRHLDCTCSAGHCGP